MTDAPDIIDLHTHSSVSDGTMAPGELFMLAQEIGLKAVALTDHDNINGLPEFLAAGREHPECEAIPGVEVACSFMCREIHIVGLFIDYRSPALQEFLAQAKQERFRRNRDLLVKLELLGYKLSMDMPEFSGCELSEAGRPHFAKALVNHYGFPGMHAVFDKLLGHNRPAYIPRRLPSPEAAIKAIHAAGGIAVWAHPVQRDSNERAYLTRAAKKLAAMGLDGIEGYYSMFSANETALVTEVAGRYGLAISGGSDFHGENSPSVVLGFGAGGLRVPVELLAALKARRIAVAGADSESQSGHDFENI
ncbi:MAG: PHP domain-containing protein [Lentisphaeria bacterium]|nr:PHP domain-containing protein [Lentisphaeria bacterium]